MARFELKLPKMGESVAEATITNWLKQVGDKIEADEAVLEIATDKVDSEVPSEVSGVLVEQLFQVNDLVQVGQTIAIIETEGGAVTESVVANEAPEEVVAIEKAIEVVLLGWVNKIGGIILFAAIYITVFSVLLFYAEQMKLLQADTIDKSVTYSFVQPWGPKAMNGFGSIVPIFKDMFSELEQFFDGVAKEISLH